MAIESIPIQQLSPTSRILESNVFCRKEIDRNLHRWESWVAQGDLMTLSRHPRWLKVLSESLKQDLYVIEVNEDGCIRAMLPLIHLKSLLFGSYLVSLPYLSYGGTLSESERAERLAISKAVELADKLLVRYLELRNIHYTEHKLLNAEKTEKVHMYLDLPPSTSLLWKQLSSKVRNLVRKGEKNALVVRWGGLDLLDDFYKVFSHNMRDLGTPVYSKKLFASILAHFPLDAELCVASDDQRPLACALLLHGKGITEVPSASSLRTYNHTCANMVMYKNLLERSIERKQDIFDFGRSSRNSSVCQFKRQWGAHPMEATWQYYLREGSIEDMRPSNKRYERLINLWKRLPLWITRCLGPVIVRGIP